MHDYKISSYLDLIRNSTNRKDLVKIPISNQKLMIETGYNQTSRNDRFCPICNSAISRRISFSLPLSKIFNPKGEILQSNPTKFCRL